MQQPKLQFKKAGPLQGVSHRDKYACIELNDGWIVKRTFNDRSVDFLKKSDGWNQSMADQLTDLINREY